MTVTFSDMLRYLAAVATNVLWHMPIVAAFIYHRLLAEILVGYFNTGFT
jgi:hypothetical protein